MVCDYGNGRWLNFSQVHRWTNKSKCYGDYFFELSLKESNQLQIPHKKPNFFSFFLPKTDISMHSFCRKMAYLHTCVSFFFFRFWSWLQNFTLLSIPLNLPSRASAFDKKFKLRAFSLIYVPKNTVVAKLVSSKQYIKFFKFKRS